MTVFSKQNYEEQDEGRIMNAARKQQYIMFPAPISFLNNELKAELRMKMKKEEEYADDDSCSLNVPMDHKDKESKTYMVKVKKYDSGTPEEFLKWRLTLNTQVKNNVYDANYDNVMNLAQSMLVGRSLEAFLNEKRLVNYSHSRNPPVCARTDGRTNPSAQRATQLRSVLARVYAVSIQNQITTTIP
jgi:hypothetical protein